MQTVVWSYTQSLCLYSQDSFVRLSRRYDLRSNLISYKQFTYTSLLALPFKRLNNKIIKIQTYSQTAIKKHRSVCITYAYKISVMLSGVQSAFSVVPWEWCRLLTFSRRTSCDVFKLPLEQSCICKKLVKDVKNWL